MRIDRISLENYRGVQQQEIEFAAPGINLLVGPNEVGKSSFFEAFALLLDDSYKHSSSAKPVLSMRPVNVDAATVIEAEFHTGPWHVVFRKQFHRNSGTELRVLAPRPAQYVGGEAHSKMAEILAEHLDLTLFNALQVLQGSPAGQVSLSDSSALSAALDATGGSAADLESSESLLSRTHEHYLRHWTASGQKSKDRRALLAQVEETQQRVATAAAAEAAVQELARGHQANQDQVEAYAESLREAEADLKDLTVEVDAAQKRQQVTQHLEQRRGELELVVTNAKQSKSAREEAAAALEQAAGKVPELAQRHTDAVTQAHTAQENAAAAKLELEKFEKALEVLQDLEKDRTRAAQLAASHQRWQQLQEQVERITQAQQSLDEASAALAQTPQITKQQVAQAEKLLLQQTELDAQQRAAAATLRVQLLNPELELLVNQEPHHFEEAADISLTAPLTVTVPGEVTLTYSPAFGASLDQDLAEVRADLAQLLTELKCADVPACRAALQNYEQALSLQQAAAKQVDSLGTPAELAQQQADLTELAALFADEANLLRATSAQDNFHDDDALPAARAAMRQARTNYDTLAPVAATSAAAVESAAQAQELAQQDLAERQTHLATQRAANSDAALNENLAAVQSGLDTVLGELEELQQKEADSALLNHFTQLTNTVATLSNQFEQAQDTASQSRAQLDVRAADGAYDNRQQAEVELERLSRDLAAQEQRAESAKYLYDLLTRHQAATKRNYVAPLRRRIEQLGRAVFGPSFEVELDDSLIITHRTLDGTTLSVEQLSTGAKEQLGVLLRLASAALVDPEGAVPLVLDDALGASDAGRLRQLAEVINEVSSTQQVIILTSAPQRYAALNNAKHITFT